MAMRWFSKRKPASNENPSRASPPQPPLQPLQQKVFPSGIKLLHDAKESLVDIVFVHGLTGDREKTWTAGNVDSPWPKILLPARLPNARFLTFGYDAYVADWRGMVSKNRISNHSWNLLTTLATYREDDSTNDRPIIFVCHSLGGLVCEDALTISRQRPERHLQKILRCTRGIIFLGTPHHGSGLALWAERLAKVIGLLKQTNPDILSVLQADSEVLARIQDSFHTMIRSRNQDGLPPIEITCFFEELPLPGVGLVVPSHSAILPGYIPMPIRSNHMDMTKFGTPEDPGYMAITGELRRWVKELDLQVLPSNVDVPKTATPQPQEVTQMVQSLSLGEPSSAQSTQPKPQTQNDQNREQQESEPQSISSTRNEPQTIPPPTQIPLPREASQTQAHQPNPSVESAQPTPTHTVPTPSPAPVASPSGINIAGTGGDVKIGSSEQYISGNFYGGVHLAGSSGQAHPWTQYLPQANMGPNERALLKAAGKGAIDEVRQLIQNGAQIDAINEEGQSALTMAITRQHLNVVKLLVENGATMDRSGFLVHKPLHVAVGTKNVEMVKFILDSGADPNEVTTVGSVLLIAVSARQEKMVTLLLSRNADPNISGSGIRSPLYKAFSTKQEAIIRMLLKHGAEVDIHHFAAVYMKRLSPACGKLLEDWASEEEYSQQVKTIRSEYADKAEKETALQSALDCASEKDHGEVESLFRELAREFVI